MKYIEMFFILKNKIIHDAVNPKKSLVRKSIKKLKKKKKFIVTKFCKNNSSLFKKKRIN